MKQMETEKKTIKRIIFFRKKDQKIVRVDGDGGKLKEGFDSRPQRRLFALNHEYSTR